MKINLQNMNLENFRVSEQDDLILVCAGTQSIWTPENLIFRSSIWSKDGELISPSFKKFFNWDEQPDIESKPSSLKECHCIEKIDGSTLIVSKYKDKIIHRTRGTFDASKLDTGHEIKYLAERYSKAFNPPESLSYIFEWVSPENRIIIDYGSKPDIYLTNIIRHRDYSYFTQKELDGTSETLNVKRPKVFDFSDIKNMIETIMALEDVEGICVYYHGDQYIRKVKSLKYLTLHQMKAGFNNKSIIKYFVENSMPRYQEFIEQLTAEIDYEVVSTMLSDISNVVDASKEVRKILDHCKNFADSVKSLTRKEAALKILSSYGKTNRTAIVFNYLDNKEPDERMLITLLTQIVLKGK
jgi:hypothetical protein